MEAGFDFDTVKVSPDQLIATAEDAFRRIERYREGLEAIDKLVESTIGSWEGEAAETFRHVYQMERGKADDALEYYANYPRELLDYAGLYSEVIHGAGAIADQVPEFSMV